MKQCFEITHQAEKDSAHWFVVHICSFFNSLTMISSIIMNIQCNLGRATNLSCFKLIICENCLDAQKLTYSQNDTLCTFSFIKNL